MSMNSLSMNATTFYEQQHRMTIIVTESYLKSHTLCPICSIQGVITIIQRRPGINVNSLLLAGNSFFSHPSLGYPLLPHSNMSEHNLTSGSTDHEPEALPNDHVTNGYEILLELCNCTSMAAVAMIFQVEIGIVVSRAPIVQQETETFERYQQLITYTREIRNMVFNVRRNKSDDKPLALEAWRELLPTSGTTMIQLLLRLCVFVEILKEGWYLELSDPQFGAFVEELLRSQNREQFNKERSKISMDKDRIFRLMNSFDIRKPSLSSIGEIYDRYIVIEQLKRAHSMQDEPISIKRLKLKRQSSYDDEDEIKST
ncbi:U2-like protein 2 [Lissonota sp. PSUC_FEM 10030012]|nr:U2-like protein 2 [Lissonota sp. PSUC_FEM 10030012]